MLVKAWQSWESQKGFQPQSCLLHWVFWAGVRQWSASASCHSVDLAKSGSSFLQTASAETCSHCEMAPFVSPQP